MNLLSEITAALRERIKQNEGVTLIELLAVIVILSIVSAVAVPVVLGNINTAKQNADKQSEAVIVEAIQRAAMDQESSSGASITGLSQTPIQLSSNSSTITFNGASSVNLTGNGTGSSAYLSSIPSAQTSTQNETFSVAGSPYTITANTSSGWTIK